VAYFLKLRNVNGDNAGYMVVTESVENTCVLEFSYDSESTNLINDLLSSKVYYLTNGDFFNITKDKKVKDNYGYIHNYDKKLEVRMKTTWDRFKIPNEKNKEAIKKVKANITGSSETPDPIKWGFLPFSSLPTTQSFTPKLITSASSVAWQSTDISPTKVNNCGPTAGLNILKYYSTRFNKPTLIYPSNLGVHDSLYTYMKTGSTGTLNANFTSGLTKWVLDNKAAGNIPSTTTITADWFQDLTWYSYEDKINNNTITYLIVWRGFDAHYVLGVGHNKYYNGQNYARICDNWGNGITKYILVYENGSVLGSIGAIGYVNISF